MIPQEAPSPAPAAAADWMVLAASDRDAGGAEILLGGPGAAAVAVAWTPASDPVADAWRPCRALGNGRWRLEGGGPERQPVGIRYRLSDDGPWSPVSVDRKMPAEPSSAQVPLLPVLVAAPLLAGAGRIGRPVAVVPGLWGGGVQDIAFQWQRDGVAIPGATGPVYLPGSEDDRTDLTCRLCATNAAGLRQAETAALLVTHAAPQVRGDLFDEVFDEATGEQAVASAPVFAGEDLRFAVAGAGAKIEPVTGLVRIPTDRPISGARVVVTASNSGGEAMRDFLVTVEAAAPAPEPVRDGENLVVAQAVASPAPDAAAGPIPTMPPAMLEAALDKPLADFGDDFGGALANNAFFGSTPSILALASWAGNTHTDRRVLAQARFSLEGEHAPTCEGGYPAQHNLPVFAMFAILRLTPRLWSAFAAAEKARIDLLMKAGLIATAFTSSDTNPHFLAGQKPEKNLRGRQSWRSGAPNFRCAAPATVQTARVYFGGTAAVDAILNGYDHAAFAEELRAAGLSNVAATFRDQPPPAPTGSQIEEAVRNWTSRGLGVADHQAMLVGEGRFTFNKTVSTGLNDGAGVKGRGKMIAGQDGLPNRGRKGMANEFDTVDGKGKRSSASYVTSGYRVIMNWLCVEMANGTLDRSAPEVRKMVEQIDIGVTDLIYKSENGYLSYAKGGPPASNNEDWVARKQAVKWGWSYTFGLWTHVLRPYLAEG
jgi:hypothetical protein